MKEKNLSDKDQHIRTFPTFEIIPGGDWLTRLGSVTLGSVDEREHSLGHLVTTGELDSQQAYDWGHALEWIERATLFPNEQARE